MTGTEIIQRFNLQVDDSSELSDSEVLALANEVYSDIQNNRSWEWLKTSFTGNTSITVPYIALPSDFKNIAINKDNEAIVFVGTTFEEYKVVGFSERREYRDSTGFCYIDIPNSRLVFTEQPTEVESIEYDYIKIAPVLLTSTSPLYTGYNNLISYGMSARFNNIELTDKSASYQRENQMEYSRMLSDMIMQDTNIKLSLS